MNRNSIAALGSGVLVTAVAIALTVNAIRFGQSSNALMLLLGFAATQIPTFLKLMNVEEKVNGNYSEKTQRINDLEAHIAELAKYVPPEDAEKVPPLPDRKEET